MLKIKFSIEYCELYSMSVLRSLKFCSRFVYSEGQISKNPPYRIFTSPDTTIPIYPSQLSGPAKGDSLDVINTYPQQLTHNKAPPDHKAASDTSRSP
jgi:hypothetical protein